MSCKKDPAERKLTISFLCRLHRFLQLQAEYQHTDRAIQVIRKAVYAAYVDLKDRGHERVALWYLKRARKSLPFLLDMRERSGGPKIFLERFENAARLYAALQKPNPAIMTEQQRIAKKHDARIALHKLWQEAEQREVKERAALILQRLGLSPTIFQ